MIRENNLLVWGKVDYERCDITVFSKEMQKFLPATSKLCPPTSWFLSVLAIYAFWILADSPAVASVRLWNFCPAMKQIILNLERVQKPALS